MRQAPRRPGFPAQIDLSHPDDPARKGTGVARAQPASPAAALRGLPPVGTMALPQVAPGEYASARARLVQALGAQGVADARVLQAMGAVERHRFLDPALVGQAYEDTSLPIGLGQTISKPNVVARMIELLLAGTPGQLGRVLEIGTGCGYQAAVLARVAREVYSIERLRGLHEKARDNLRPLRLANVHLLLGDGMLGFPKGAPYAGIIAAAGGEAVPETWLDQLAVGGRIVAPVAGAAGTQALVVIERGVQGFTQSILEAVHFVPLKSGIA